MLTMKRERYIIAIDGPAGAGKSTVSKTVAKTLGYIYIDTGAMYRALALKAQRLGYDFVKEDAVVEMARKSVIELKPGKTKDSLLEIYLDGEDVSEKIRTPEVSQGASKISALGGIRKVLQEKQREIGNRGGVVMEGRDIGTAVFPDAEFKFYLDASVKERARRRYKELKAKGTVTSLEEIEKEIVIRDERDKNRKNDPLTQAPDAIYIDSTGMSVDENAKMLVDIVKKGKI